MASEGPNYPSSGVSTSRTSGVAWSNVTGALGDDASNANCYGDNDPTISEYLDVTNFGFSIPAGATIDGVVSTLERRAENTGYIGDETYQLINQGSPSGDDKATATNWPASMTTEDHGGVADTWSLSLTPTTENDSTSGVRVAADVEFDYTAYVDYVSKTVYYTAGSSGSTGGQGGLLGGGLVDAGLVDSGLVG